MNIVRIGAFLLLSVVGSVIYGQAPLYTSNQNQYFLHGLASAGLGHLSDDWLARTADPTPVFSFLVAGTYRVLREYMFYGYAIVLAGVYFFSLVGIASHLFNLGHSRGGFLAYLGLLMTMHAALLGNLSLGMLGVDVRMVLTSGVAGLGIPGDILQPSLFGVLLVASVYAFLMKRPFLAVVCAGLAAIVHPTYLLGASVLVSSYAVVTLAETGKVRAALLIGLAGLALVAPMAGYVYYAFRPTSAAAAAAAADILINLRSPHHFLVQRWLGPTAYLQIAIMVAGLLVARRSRRLYLVLLFSFVTAAVLTCVWAISGNTRLAVLIPWRLSAYIVPIATSVLAAAAVSWVRDRYVRGGARGERALVWAGCVTMLVLLLAGALYMRRDIVDSQQDASVPMMDFVRRSAAAGDVYLIPLDLERFRLYTAAPIFADRKSIPYRDVELVEWYERYRVGTAFYQLNDPALTCDALARLSSRYRMTRVVLLKGQTDGRCPLLQGLYEDGEYGVYRLGAR